VIDFSTGIDGVDFTKSVVEVQGWVSVVIENLDTVLEHIWILIISSVAGLASFHQSLEKSLLGALIIQNEVNLKQFILKHDGLSNISWKSVDQEFLELSCVCHDNFEQ